LIKIASYSPARWLLAPPAATAAFSSARSPGVVLRVSSTLAPVPCTAFAARAAIVATPDRCARKFSAVRSPVNSARALPCTASTGPPCSRHCPLLNHALETSVGVQPRETPLRRAPGRRSTRAPSCVISARAMTRSPTVAAVVTSPAPTSSASAHLDQLLDLDVHR